MAVRPAAVANVSVHERREKMVRRRVRLMDLRASWTVCICENHGKRSFGRKPRLPPRRCSEMVTPSWNGVSSFDKYFATSTPVHRKATN